MKTFARAALVRAARTTAQAAVALLPATAITLGSIDWATIGAGAALAGIASLLTSVATDLPEAPKPGRHSPPDVQED